MLKAYDDGAIYVGEMKDGKRNGKGTLYVLTDFFAGYKISGTWENDKLNGWGIITNKDYCEKVMYENGVKNGVGFRKHNETKNAFGLWQQGRIEKILYKEGKLISKKEYTKSKSGGISEKTFGVIKLNKNHYYLGDICEGRPFCFGMLFKTDNNNQFEKMLFCEIYDGKIINGVDMSHINQNKIERKQEQ